MKSAVAISVPRVAAPSSKIVTSRAADPHGRQHVVDGRHPPRDVRQHQHALARAAHRGERLRHARIGLQPVMDAAPEIEDEGVVAVGDRAEAGKNTGGRCAGGDGHGTR